MCEVTSGEWMLCAWDTARQRWNRQHLQCRRVQNQTDSSQRVTLDTEAVSSIGDHDRQLTERDIGYGSSQLNRWSCGSSVRSVQMVMISYSNGTSWRHKNKNGARNVIVCILISTFTTHATELTYNTTIEHTNLSHDQRPAWNHCHLNYYQCQQSPTAEDVAPLASHASYWDLSPLQQHTTWVCVIECWHATLTCPIPTTVSHIVSVQTMKLRRPVNTH